MSVDKTVKLCPSGGTDYWYARYYTSQGKRRRVVIGRKDELSKRAAEKKCGELAEKLAKEPSRRDVMECPKLGPWLDHYLKLRTDLGEASMVWHRLVVAKLKECFGEDTRVDKITRADAADFQAKASKFKKAGGGTISDFTAHKYVVVAARSSGTRFVRTQHPSTPSTGSASARRRSRRLGRTSPVFSGSHCTTIVSREIHPSQKKSMPLNPYGARHYRAGP